MRYGTPARFKIDYSTLLPVVAPADPSPVPAVRVHAPDGDTLDVDPGDLAHDAAGTYHYDSGPLDQPGRWRFVARATGFPEIRMDVEVEASAW